jgi:hypothetical protein
MERAMRLVEDGQGKWAVFNTQKGCAVKLQKSMN